MAINDLFETDTEGYFFSKEALLLSNFISKYTPEILEALKQIIAISPFRKMLIPQGYQMSVSMTNCGDVGWTSDLAGYKYTAEDPLTGKPWPEMPIILKTLAIEAATKAGFTHFQPNACLINCYAVDSKMSLHQDRDEHNLRTPIVSFSLGLPAIFLWGGLQRNDKVHKLTLYHGDAVVWGGVDRLRFHGIASLISGCHPALGMQRINLTFREVC